MAKRTRIQDHTYILTLHQEDMGKIRELNKLIVETPEFMENLDMSSFLPMSSEMSSARNFFASYLGSIDPKSLIEIIRKVEWNQPHAICLLYSSEVNPFFACMHFGVHASCPSEEMHIKVITDGGK